MKNRQYLLASVCAAALVASASAYAADTTGKAETGVKAQSQTTAAERKSRVQTNASADINADELIGAEIENYDGDNVGDIESVIIDQSGKVQAVVVGVGGFLGMGERRVALDWNELEISENGDKVRVNATAESLKQKKPYEYADEKWRGSAYEDKNYAGIDMDDTEQRAAAQRGELDRDRDMGDKVSDAGESAKNTAREGVTATKKAANNTTDAVRNAVAADTLYDASGRLSAEALIGEEIVNGSDEVVGEIEDVLISDSGELSVVVAAGGFLGIGEERILLPWSDLKISRHDDMVQIRTSAKTDAMKKMSYDRDGEKSTMKK